MAIPKLVYSLTTEGRDLYSSMTRVSVLSARLSNPHLKISVACDAVSAAALEERNDPLLAEVDELVVSDTPAGSALFRNRFVKTALRSKIEGPFLFVDSDTLLRGDLSEAFDAGVDVACAANHSRDRVQDQIWAHDLAKVHLMGWPIRNDVYFNGGVIYFNDTVGARLFARDWHEKWRRSHELDRSHKDQPALNAAIFASAPKLKVLPHRFNAQFKTNPATVAGALLWHYCAESIGGQTTTFEMLVARVLDGDPLSPGDVRELVDSFHPWRRGGRLDDLVARRVIRSGRLLAADETWFGGHRLKSIGLRMASAVLGADPQAYMREIGRRKSALRWPGSAGGKTDALPPTPVGAAHEGRPGGSGPVASSRH